MQSARESATEQFAAARMIANPAEKFVGRMAKPQRMVSGSWKTQVVLPLLSIMERVIMIFSDQG
tara:strand:- start:3881 stop:4072 length:192 start_codon:yes stop_codon:yes gene_type:complete